MASVQLRSLTKQYAGGVQIAKRPKKGIVERIGDVVRILRLEDYLKRPGNLAGGQRQRVAMVAPSSGRALGCCRWTGR